MKRKGDKSSKNLDQKSYLSVPLKYDIKKLLYYQNDNKLEINRKIYTFAKEPMLFITHNVLAKYLQLYS